MKERPTYRSLRRLGQLLKQKRIAEGQSSSGAASKVGVTAAYYSRLENGKQKPSRSLLKKISEGLNIPAEDMRLFEHLAGYDTSSQQESVNEEGRQQQTVGVKLDPDKYPILFSDGMYVTISENGVVFDFAQKIGTTNEQIIVARVGVTHHHAQKIHDVLGKQLSRIGKEGGIDNQEGPLAN